MLLRVINGILAALVVYLAGAFIAADFNISNWDTEGRGLLGIIMPFAAFFAACCPFFED